ncbi:MAG: phosphonate ABC transporter, permease protein PhnE [Hyphomonadaceae bacterium]|nr:MAG: phosphonate transport system permease protein [Caulobacteraceae bacterium]MBT9445661.1 phosphonate ABC transporter, permease protein PhnE [Hyphomonadaceae bacterium]TPW05566.1 MAG: phosphonate transport system permease protein [Alphaproteobacteria bacterium]
MNATVASARLIAPEALEPPVGRKVRPYAVAIALIVVLVWFCIDLEMTPAVFGKGLASLRRFIGAMIPPHDGGQPWRIVLALVETFAMAVSGTAIAAVFAAPLGVLAAKAVVRNAVIHFAVRRVMDLFRGIPALVWALILVSAVGLGPFAGVLALAFADIPRLAKLHAEAIENLDQRPLEALRAAGAGRLAAIRFAAVPQLAPIWSSQILYYLEQNFRNAAILGIVGAGGIGFALEERIRIFAFDQVAYIVLLYCVCVGILDWISSRIRARLT